MAPDAEDGKNVVFSLELCPPSAMNPPRSKEKVPIPEVPPLPTIAPNCGDNTFLFICSHINFPVARDICVPEPKPE